MWWAIWSVLVGTRLHSVPVPLTWSVSGNVRRMVLPSSFHSVLSGMWGIWTPKVTGFGLDERNTSSGIRFASAGSVLDFLPPMSSPSVSRLFDMGGATGGLGLTNRGGGIRGSPPGGGGGGIPRDKHIKKVSSLHVAYLHVTCTILQSYSKELKSVGR